MSALWEREVKVGEVTGVNDDEAIALDEDRKDDPDDDQPEDE